MTTTRTCIAAAALCAALGFPAGSHAQAGPGTDAEFRALMTAPPSRWEVLMEGDSMSVEGFTDTTGPAPVYWTRGIYAQPQPLSGRVVYDVLYARYAPECETRSTRLVRIVWTRGSTPVAEEPMTLPADEPAAGSIGHYMVDAACAGMQPARAERP